MKCDNIILYKVPTNDDDNELEGNRAALKHKYEKRGQKCYCVDMDHGKVTFPDLRNKGTVGVYLIGHTGNCIPTQLGPMLVDQLVGADVKKINLGCCKGVDKGFNKLGALCTELIKAGTTKGQGSFLKADLLVCAFTVNITTVGFDLGIPYTDSGLQRNFDNKDEVKAKGRQVAKVEQDYDHRAIYTLHEKVTDGEAVTLQKDVEKAFGELLPISWNKEKNAFIGNEQKLKNDAFMSEIAPRLSIENFGGLTKAGKQTAVAAGVKGLDWEGLCHASRDLAKGFVQKVGWQKFVEALKGHDSHTAKIWSSLEAYANKKKAMRYDGAKFVEVPLSKYTENADLKAALTFVEMATKTQGGARTNYDPHYTVTLKFLPT